MRGRADEYLDGNLSNQGVWTMKTFKSMMTAAVLVLSTTSVGCNAVMGPSPEVKAGTGIQGMFERQEACLNNGDLEGYLNTIHPDSRERVRSDMSEKGITSKFKLNVKYNKIEVSDQSGNGDGATATAHTVVTTRCVDASFRDNIATADYELVRHDGSWMVKGTRLKSIEWIEKK